MIVVAYLIVVAVLSLTGFVMIAWDKRRAERGGRRIAERTLHIVELLGGWPGMLIARAQFRHKTRKLSYRITSVAMIVLHLAAIGGGVYLMTRG